MPAVLLLCVMFFRMILLCYVVLCYVILSYLILSYLISCFFILLFYFMLSYLMLCHVMLFMLCYVILRYLVLYEVLRTKYITPKYIVLYYFVYIFVGGEKGGRGVVVSYAASATVLDEGATVGEQLQRMCVLLTNTTACATITTTTTTTTVMLLQVALGGRLGVLSEAVAMAVVLSHPPPFMRASHMVTGDPDEANAIVGQSFVSYSSTFYDVLQRVYGKLLLLRERRLFFW